MHMDLDTLAFAIVAIVVLTRLWFVLGTRSEDEPQQPNPFIPPTPLVPANDEPFTPRGPLPLAVLPPESLAGGLAQVKIIDPAFDEKTFLQEAREIFTAVVETYATGDMGGIATSLSPALLAHFQNAADARKAAGQKAQSHVAAIKDAEAVAARAEATQAFVTVKFVSDQENILRDSGGTIIGGAVSKTEEITDTWVFTRDTQTPDSKWVLVETRG
jgi:predicted lipid-binding transport protein (Tim44 family)